MLPKNFNVLRLLLLLYSGFDIAWLFVHLPSSLSLFPAIVLLLVVRRCCCSPFTLFLETVVSGGLLLCLGFVGGAGSGFLRSLFLAARSCGNSSLYIQEGLTVPFGQNLAELQLFARTRCVDHGLTVRTRKTVETIHLLERCLREGGLLHELIQAGHDH